MTYSLSWSPRPPSDSVTMKLRKRFSRSTCRNVTLVSTRSSCWPGALSTLFSATGAGRIGTNLILAPRGLRGFMRRARSIRVDLEAMDVADDHAVGECAEQRDRGDVDERPDERAGRVVGDADDERRDDAGEVGHEVEEPAGQPDQLLRRDVGDDRPPQVGHALAEEGERHDPDDQRVVVGGDV